MVLQSDFNVDNIGDSNLQENTNHEQFSVNSTSNVNITTNVIDDLSFTTNNNELTNNRLVESEFTSVNQIIPENYDYMNYNTPIENNSNFIQNNQQFKENSYLSNSHFDVYYDYTTDVPYAYNYNYNNRNYNDNAAYNNRMYGKGQYNNRYNQVTSQIYNNYNEYDYLNQSSVQRNYASRSQLNIQQHLNIQTQYMQQQNLQSQYVPTQNNISPINIQRNNFSPINLQSQNMQQYNMNSLSNNPFNKFQITKEMISVANTTTMSKFANEQVCQQINKILENQPKNHQTIILAERGSNWNDQNNLKSLDDDSVLNLLKETGFSTFSADENKNSTIVEAQSCINTTNNEINNARQSISIQSDGCNKNNESQSPKLLGNVVGTNKSALDLSISSDEDAKLSKYRVNTNNNIVNLNVSPNQNNTSKTMNISNINQAGNVSTRRLSETVNTNNQFEGQQNQTLNEDYNISRTRSFGSQPENLSTSYGDEVNEPNSVDVFQNISQKMDNLDLNSRQINNQYYGNINNQYSGNTNNQYSVNTNNQYSGNTNNQYSGNTNNQYSGNNVGFINNTLLNESMFTRMSLSYKKTQIPSTPEVNNIDSSIYLDNRNLLNISNLNKIYNTNYNYQNNRNIPVQENVKKEKYSRKVFVGGLPQDINEEEIAIEFKRFGELLVDWPHKIDSSFALPPKGYAFLLFSNSESVLDLIKACQIIDDKFYWTVSSKASEGKQVQIRPWTLTDAVWSIRVPIIKPVPRCKQTVFVGGIPRQAQAKDLFDNMNRCFGGVQTVEIDVDLEYSYPKGAASVTFENAECYMKALETHFITLKLCGLEKRVEIKPFFSDDQHCESCGVVMGSRISNSNPNSSCSQSISQCFCVARGCLKYFCDGCWIQHQIQFGHNESHHSGKIGTGLHRQFIFKRGVYSTYSNRQNTN